MSVFVGAVNCAAGDFSLMTSGSGVGSGICSSSGIGSGSGVGVGSGEGSCTDSGSNCGSGSGEGSIVNSSRLGCREGDLDFVFRSLESGSSSSWIGSLKASPENRRGGALIFFPSESVRVSSSELIARSTVNEYNDELSGSGELPNGGPSCNCGPNRPIGDGYRLSAGTWGYLGTGRGCVGLEAVERVCGIGGVGVAVDWSLLL